MKAVHLINQELASTHLVFRGWYLDIGWTPCQGHLELLRKFIRFGRGMRPLITCGRRWLHVTLNLKPWNWLSNWYCLAAERERQRGNEDASKHPAPSLHPPQPSLLLHTRLNLNPPSPPSFALNISSLLPKSWQMWPSQMKDLEILGNC